METIIKISWHYYIMKMRNDSKTKHVQKKLIISNKKIIIIIVVVIMS